MVALGGSGSAGIAARSVPRLHPVVMDAALLVDDAPAAADARADASSTWSKAERIYSSAELHQRLSRPDGQLLILLFAAKSCRACRALLPKMERLAARRGARLLSVYHEAATSGAFVDFDVHETPTAHTYDGTGALMSRDVVSAQDLPKLDQLLRTLAEG